MRYSYEFKRKCVEMYRQGKWEQTPEGVSQSRFRKYIRTWKRTEDAKGPEALKHKSKNKVWSVEDKYYLVAQVLAGNSISSVAIEAGINTGLLYQWLNKYEKMGYNGLINKKKGRPSKKTDMKKKNLNIPKKLNESEREELIRLRAEIEYIKTENAVIKKEIALREEKRAAQLKARRQQSSKNSKKKDTILIL